MKEIISGGPIIVIALSIGGKVLMDRREEDDEELCTIQTGLVNYLYNRYEIYAKDKDKIDEVNKKYNGGNGTITDDEYLGSLRNARQYFNTERMEFTGFSVAPVKSLEVHLKINSLSLHTATLGVKSAETDQRIYRIDSGIERPGQDHYLSRKDQGTNRSISMNIVIFYDGGID